ncbi:MAG: phosphotransferase [Nanoarchaeota archaeon]|nr:phosphotransferase [Nanoarchaeota archaeon]
MYKKEIKEVIRTHYGELGISKVNHLKISRLGVGENNISMLAVVDDKKLVFRIGIKKDLEKNMKREFDYMKKLPDGLAADPIFFDNSKKIIPKIYSVLSFIPGKHIVRWSDKHLKAYAKSLAMLHRKKFNFWEGLDGKRYKLFNILNVFEDDLKDYGFISEDDDIQLLLPYVRKYLKNHNHYFKSLKYFSLCHIDPCITNVLWAHKEVKFIDWEWSRVFDNAVDVGMFYKTDFAMKPWCIKLSRKRENLYLSEYLKYNPDKTLRQRVKVWKVCNDFLELVYFKWKVKNYHKDYTELPKVIYENSVKGLLKILKN